MECLSREGYPGAEIQPDGTTSIDLADGQFEGYNTAAALCLKEVCDACGQPIDEATLQRLYQLQLDARTCLGDAGIDLPEAPSFQTYRDASADSRWSPFRDALPALMATGQADEIEEECPDPESYVTYW